jgi:hypothetical protein
MNQVWLVIALNQPDFIGTVSDNKSKVPHRTVFEKSSPKLKVQRKFNFSIFVKIDI